MEQDRIDKSLKRLRNLVKGKFLPVRELFRNIYIKFIMNFLIFAEDTSKHGHIPEEFIEDDKFLLRFIRVRKFDCERAHAMVNLL